MFENETNAVGKNQYMLKEKETKLVSSKYLSHFVWNSRTSNAVRIASVNHAPGNEFLDLNHCLTPLSFRSLTLNTILVSVTIEQGISQPRLHVQNYTTRKSPKKISCSIYC